MSRREYPEVPRVGVGAIVIRDGKVLLIKRGSPPNADFWAIPGGMLELGETLQQGAEREIFEETGIRIRAGKPIYTFDFLQHDPDGRIHYHYVIVDLEATYLSGDIRPADDALDAHWATPEECLALSVSKKTLDLLRGMGFIHDLNDGRDHS